MLKSSLFHLIESSVNLVLKRDPKSDARLQTLEDKIIKIEISDLNLCMYWIFENHRVRIVSNCSADVDASISGPVQAIARLGLTKAKVAKDLTISGDMHVVEAFKNLFAQLDIDWEAQLAPFTGDALAYKLGKTAKDTFSWLKKSAQSFRQNTKDYLEEEINLLPSRLRFTDFSNDVRQLSRDADKLAAKIKRLQSS